MSAGGWPSGGRHDVLPLSLNGPGVLSPAAAGLLLTADQGNDPLEVFRNVGAGSAAQGWPDLLRDEGAARADLQH